MPSISLEPKRSVIQYSALNSSEFLMFCDANGRVSSSSDVQPANTESSSVSTPLSATMVLAAEQPLNALPFTVLTFEGIEMPVIPEQPAKVSAFISDIVDGIISSVNFSQPLNAPEPISVIAVGIMSFPTGVGSSLS